jgi:hypothetical protein
MVDSVMTYRFCQRAVVLMACMLAAGLDSAPASAARQDAGPCVAAAPVKTLADLREASGVALSRRTPGLLWSHNDSGQPLLYAVDAATGAVRGRVRVAGATVEDWEDVSMATCPGGSCLYIADIGDNRLARRFVTIYRISEPQPQDAESSRAEVFTAVYPDGPHDAEALFVAADDLYIVTKDATTAIYRLPKPLRAGDKMMLERVAGLALKRVTDAETSVDGKWVAVRTNQEIGFYRPAEIGHGTPRGITVSLRALKEPQGEGVALDGQKVYLTGEGSRGGTLNLLRCMLAQTTG